MLRYAITDRALCGGSREGLLAACVRVAPQVDYLQVRERDWSAREMEIFCAQLTQALNALPNKPVVLVNHRLDVALACGMPGVHLRSQGELRAEQVRAAYARCGLPAPVVSVSCHSADEAASAAQSGADLLLFGAVFGKSVDGDDVSPAAGLDALSRAVEAADGVPVLALGGVTEDRIADCLAAGAAGVAAIRMFFSLR